jgi:hypothetical protein
MEQPLPIADRIAMLNSMANMLLAQNLPGSFVDLMMPTMFTLAPGGRGDVSEWPPSIEPGQVSIWPRPGWAQ